MCSAAAAAALLLLRARQLVLDQRDLALQIGGALAELLLRSQAQNEAALAQEKRWLWHKETRGFEKGNEWLCHKLAAAPGAATGA